MTQSLLEFIALSSFDTNYRENLWAVRPVSLRAENNQPEEEEEEEAEVPTLVPTVISWWTLLWREDSVLEAAGRETQNNKPKKG